MKTDKVREKIILLYGPRAEAGDYASEASVKEFRASGYFRHLNQNQMAVHDKGGYRLTEKGALRLRGDYLCKYCKEINTIEKMWCAGICQECYKKRQKMYRDRYTPERVIEHGSDIDDTDKNYVLRSFYQLKACHGMSWFKDYDGYKWELIASLLPVFTEYSVDVSNGNYRFKHHAED